MISDSYQFPILSKDMHEKIKRWHVDHNDGKCANRYHGAIGGDISFIITPTSIGEFIEVQCSCGDKLSIDNI